MGGNQLQVAEGTGSGFWTIWHQIGNQRKKSTVKAVGGAPVETGKPRNRGYGRVNAAGLKRLRSGKFLGSVLGDGSSDLVFVLGFEGERQGR